MNRPPVAQWTLFALILAKSPEAIENSKLVFLGAGFALVWVGVGVYLFWIVRRQRDLEDRMTKLQAAQEKD